MKIGAYMVIHNGVEYDYCFEAALSSLLAFCDEVVAVEAGSTDETPYRLFAMANPKLRIVCASWKPAPIDQAKDIDWLRDLQEFGRKRLSDAITYQVHCQADEVFHEDDFSKIQTAASENVPAIVNRLNFWVDHRHTAPENEVCGKYICRLGPVNLPGEWGQEVLRAENAILTKIRLFHYGFLRRGDGFAKKSRVMELNLLGSRNPISERAATEGTKIFTEHFPVETCDVYSGSHPVFAKRWLNERGFHD